MAPGIIILNGTSSSGKTSLLEVLQTRLAEPYLNAGIDKFIWMLPERYLERLLWDDVLGLATRAGATGHTLFPGCITLLQRLPTPAIMSSLTTCWWSLPGWTSVPTCSQTCPLI